MTSKELLYKWVCDKIENGESRFSFKQVDDETGTYFEEVKAQPELNEYAIKSRIDMEKNMEKYFDVDLTEIETVCIRAFLDGILKIEEGIESEGRVKSKTQIREYIYNF